MPKTPKELKLLLEKQQNEFIGEHSAVKICTWTKKSLKDEGVCYKEKFYGISSHRCCQLSPSMNFCQNACIFCWRPIEHTIGTEMKPPIDDPKSLIANAIKAQRKLLNGFPGNPKTNMKKFKEAQEPNQFAISLSGEPAIYPRLGELIAEIKKKDATSYVVTNGLLPDKLKTLDPLPTNLYISLDAPDEETFKKIDQPKLKDAWQRLNTSLEILKTLDTTTVLRITLIKDMNMFSEAEYAKLIEKASPRYVELKAYMFVGASRHRLAIENMPYHKEVKEFTDKILKHLKNYTLKDEKKESRVVLLSRI